MLAFSSRFAILLSILAALSVGAGAARAQQSLQSQAMGLDARFVSHGVASELGPIGAVSGAPSGKYDYAQAVANLNQSVALAPALLTPTLSVQIEGMKAHVSSSGLQIDSRQSEGDNSAKTISLTLTVSPPPGSSAPLPVPALLIKGREVMSTASLNTVYGSHVSSLGLVSLGTLTVSGQLLGGRSLIHSGQTAPNTVLYDSPTLKIVLNRQVKSAADDCGPDCAPSPPSIDIVAVDVALHNAPVGGSTVTGHIRLGEAIAQ